MKPEDLERLGVLCADLLEQTESWIARRKEVVSILDESALKRQLSVDFTLRDCPGHDRWEKLTDEIFGKKIAAAPLFFLEKRPAWLMGFDLRDESGKAQPLMTSGDNGRLSAAMLEQLAKNCLEAQGMSLSPTVAAMLKTLARGRRAQAERWLRRFEFPLPSDAEEDRDAMAALWNDENMQWWLMTMAKASVVLVAYEKSSAQRRILKLSYDEPIGNQPKIWARIGWAPFKTWIVSPFIEGERYHLEVQSPRGMRLTRAALIDDEHEHGPLVDLSLTRRSHLYVDDARRSGGTLAEIWLRVSGQAFLGGASLSAALVCLAIGACLHWNHEIAENPTGAPALLLLLPAVIASYVARPGQHPLTTHLLSRPRWALLVAGGAAYYAATRLALAGSTPKTTEEISDRAAAIDSWLWPPLAVAVVGFLVLSIGWLASRRQSHAFANRIRRIWSARHMDRFELLQDLPLTMEAALGHCRGELEPALSSPGARSRADGVRTAGWRYVLFRTSGWITWAHDFRVQRGAAGALIVQTFVAHSKHLPDWVVALYVGVRRRRARRRGEVLSRRLRAEQVLPTASTG